MLCKLKYIVDSLETYIDDMSIVALFNHFCCVYYQLDEIYSKRIGTSLRGIMEDKYLDYSKLQLYVFYDSEKTIDNSFLSFF